MLAFLLPLAMVEERVSFDSPARPAPEVVRALGERAGEPLRTDAIFGRQILAAHFEDVPLPEALDRLAKTLGGRWEADGKVRRLVRPPSLAREIEAQERRARIEGLRRTIDDLGRRVKVEDPFSAAEALSAAKAGTVTDRSPITRLLVRLLDDEILGAGIALGPSDRAVWTARPHPSQKGFSAGQIRRLTEFGVELRTWQTAVAAANPNSRGPLGYRSELSVEGDPARVLLVISRHASSRGLHAKLLVANGLGQVTGRQMLNLPEAKATSDPIPPRKGELADLRLSEAGQKLARMEWSVDLAWPTRRDPLAEAAALLVQAAARRRPNVLAVVPDPLFRAYPELAKRAMTSADVLEIAGRSGVSFREEGDWAILKPDLPWSAERLRLDRAAMERMLRGLIEGRAFLDPIAGYVAEGGEAAWTWGELDYALASVCAASRQLPEIPFDASALATFGSLTRAERQALVESGSLPVGRLSPRARARLERMVYTTMGMRLRMEGRPPEEDADALRQLELSLRSENTEILPRGLLPDAVLKARRQVEGEAVTWHFHLSLGGGASLGFQLKDVLP
ncbi:MAG: hypothetical protein ACO1SV_18265 [Fimbriimonas sp.]